MTGESAAFSHMNIWSAASSGCSGFPEIPAVTPHHRLSGSVPQELSCRAAAMHLGSFLLAAGSAAILVHIVYFYVTHLQTLRAWWRMKAATLPVSDYFCFILHVTIHWLVTAWSSPPPLTQRLPLAWWKRALVCMSCWDKQAKGSVLASTCQARGVDQVQPLGEERSLERMLRRQPKL